MSVRRWTPDVIAAPVGKYSHLATVPAGSSTVYMSGQVGIDAQGRLAGDTLTAQTAQIFANIEALLEELGAGPDNIVKLLSFVVGPADLAGFAAARDEVYARWFPNGDWPAHSLAFVSALARPDLLVEMEGIIVLSGQR